MNYAKPSEALLRNLGKLILYVAHSNCFGVQTTNIMVRQGILEDELLGREDNQNPLFLSLLINHDNQGGEVKW